MALYVLPAAPPGGDALPLPGHQGRRRHRPVGLTRRQRRRIEGLIERLIRILDSADRDPDFEPEMAEDGAPGERSHQVPMTPATTRPTAPMTWWGRA